MKTIRLYFFLFVLCFCNSLFAQKESSNRLLFPYFEKGIIIFKTEVCSPALLNYDMLEQNMVFMEADSSIFSINNHREILAVVIGERRFLPISSKGIFYEEIQTGKGSFFVNRSAHMFSEGKEAAYGGYSQTSSVTSYGSWRDNMGTSVTLNTNEKFKLEINYFYYLKSGNRYKRFFSAKTLGKLFKGHESEIKEFANEQSINFAKTDDVARIVEYGYSLISNP